MDSELKKYTAKFLEEEIIKPFMRKKGYPKKVIDSIEVKFNE